jgi:hypothetical protein
MDQSGVTREHPAIDAAALLYETRMALAAVHHGVETLIRRSDNPSATSELRLLGKLTDQACEALEALHRAIARRLSN